MGADPVPLVRRLAELRREAGISQSEMARRIKSTQSHVSDVESGAKDARLSTLERIASVLRWRIELIQPPCDTCRGEPPPGFTCNGCGRTTERPDLSAVGGAEGHPEKIIEEGDGA